MVLHAENRLGTMAQSFDGLVVEVDAVDFDFGRKCRGINGKTVVLGGDLDAAGFQILHRLIGPAMAELELESAAAECLAEDLVAEANAEHRDSMTH